MIDDVLATFHLFSGDHVTARDFAKTAIKFNPSYAPSYWRLSIANAHYGDFGEAEKNGLKTLELSPVDSEIPNFLIKVSSKLAGNQKIKTFTEYINIYCNRNSIILHSLTPSVISPILVKQTD